MRPRGLGGCARRASRAVACAVGLLCLTATGLWHAQDEVLCVPPGHVTLAMLEQARVGPQDFVLDLGSGEAQAATCDCSWRSAAAARSAAKPGSLWR